MTRPAGTESFALNQTMLRIRDPEPSLAFYQDVLGMTLLQKLDFPEMEFSLYFLAYLSDQEKIPDDPKERARFIFNRKTTLELTHNWETENDSTFKGYHDGNSNPRGFGHIGISVANVAEACDRFAAMGVTFKKRPQDGKMKDIAFITDPDGYWIEILSASGMVDSLTGQA